MGKSEDKKSFQLYNDYIDHLLYSMELLQLLRNPVLLLKSVNLVGPAQQMVRHGLRQKPRRQKL